MHHKNRHDERNAAVALSTASMQDEDSASAHMRIDAYTACHTRIFAHNYNGSNLIGQDRHCQSCFNAS